MMEAHSPSMLEHWLMRAAAANHRTLLVLAGPRSKSLECATVLLAPLERESTLWISDQPALPGPTEYRPRPDRLVGMELDAVVLDVWAGFDADVFGAVAGAIRGCGALVLCTPQLDDWPKLRDPCAARFQVFPGGLDAVGARYLSRFAALLRVDSRVLVARPEVRSIPRCWSVARPDASDRIDLNEAQTNAVAAICHVVTGQRRRPVVLTADRGRGKSTVLGCAAASLVREGVRRIVVTAVERKAVDVVLASASMLLDGRPGSDRISWGEAEIEFMNPWHLLESDGGADLVLVDEAAALPLHWHARALERFSRIAFASTVHGYEGSGRGFAVRLTSLLQRFSRGWREVRLDTPVRWAPEDPVEAFVFDALVLNAEVEPTAAQVRFDLSNCSVSRLDRRALIDDEFLLRGFFGLLIQSHYRTRPNDLRYLLDAPNVELLVARVGQMVVGAAVIAREGGFDERAIEQVWSGNSRPRGHMLAETMSAQLGERDWPAMRGLRIVRIAVHAQARRRGVGSRLVRWILDQAAQDACDYAGSSFAIGADVAAFWTSNGLMPVWLGARRNTASGARSLLMVRSLSRSAHEMTHRARDRFLKGFAIRLSGLYADEDPAHVALMFGGASRHATPPAGRDFEEVVRFAVGGGGFESCFPGIWEVTQFVLSDHRLLSMCSMEERALLIRVVLQQESPAQIVLATGVNGRKPVIDALRSLFRRIAVDQREYLESN